MTSSNSFSLQEYKIQRQYREDKRKQYLNQFQTLRQRMGIVQGQVAKPPIIVQNMIPIKAVQKNIPKQSDQNSAIEQNNKLKQKLSELQLQQREKLTKFKQQIAVAKQQYINKIKQVSQIGNAQKVQTQSKIKKLEEQISSANNKNKEIQEYNKRIQEQTLKSFQIMDKYSSEIKKQYDQKLQEFNVVFNTSNQKIQGLEDQYNQQEFIDATLQNQQLIQSIKENAQKGEQEIGKIITDYRELLNGKTQILQSLTQNNKMKEEQIEKMTTLEEKLKIIFEKINEEKKIYLDQNKKMAEELIQVKQLLTKAMGQS